MSNACWHIWEVIHINTLPLNTNLWWHESSNTTTLARFVNIYENLSLILLLWYFLKLFQPDITSF